MYTAANASHLFAAVKISIFTADYPSHTVQMADVETIWEFAQSILPHAGNKLVWML